MVQHRIFAAVAWLMGIVRVLVAQDVMSPFVTVDGSRSRVAPEPPGVVTNTYWVSNENSMAWCGGYDGSEFPWPFTVREPPTPEGWGTWDEYEMSEGQRVVVSQNDDNYVDSGGVYRSLMRFRFRIGEDASSVATLIPKVKGWSEGDHGAHWYGLYLWNTNSLAWDLQCYHAEGGPTVITTNVLVGAGNYVDVSKDVYMLLSSAHEGIGNYMWTYYAELKVVKQ